MNDKYANIYERARPYLDTRHNDIHTSIVYSFAVRLLEMYPDANADVVLPAVILHDVGWKMIPEDQQLKAFGPKVQDEDLRRVHEVEGARIAGEILSEVEYDPVKREEILAIIDGHDSRETALSLNDELVKDSDKLWRCTQTAIEINHRRFNVELQEYVEGLSQKIENWFFTTGARQMARESYAEAKSALLGEG